MVYYVLINFVCFYIVLKMLYKYSKEVNPNSRELPVKLESS